MGKEVKSMNNVKVRTKLIIVMLGRIFGNDGMCCFFDRIYEGDADKGTGNDRVR